MKVLSSKSKMLKLRHPATGTRTWGSHQCPRDSRSKLLSISNSFSLKTEGCKWTLSLYRKKKRISRNAPPISRRAFSKKNKNLPWKNLIRCAPRSLLIAIWMKLPNWRHNSKLLTWSQRASCHRDPRIRWPASRVILFLTSMPSV